MSESEIIKSVVSPSGQIMLKNVMQTLYKHYPDHKWLCKVDEDGGIIAIYNLRFSGTQGYILHIGKMDPEYRCVMNAGGEILERYRQRRGQANERDLMDVVGMRDFKGEIAYDA